MNSKASKSQIQFPPLLNLCNDRPHIDNSMRNWEKVNGPYLNDMIRPLYMKDEGASGTYDYNGKKHTIKDGEWKIDSISRLQNLEYTFKRTVLGKLNIRALTYDDNSDYYYLDNNNKLWHNDEYVADFTVNGEVETCKMAYLNSKLHTVIISVIDGTQYISYYENNTLKFYKPVVWYKQYASHDGSAIETVSLTVSSSDPIINIAYNNNDIWISLVSNYGSAINVRYNGFATYLSDGRQVGNDIMLENLDDVRVTQKVLYKDNVTANYSISKSTEVALSDAIPYINLRFAERAWSYWVSLTNEESPTGQGGIFKIVSTDCPDTTITNNYTWNVDSSSGMSYSDFNDEFEGRITRYESIDAVVNGNDSSFDFFEVKNPNSFNEVIYIDLNYSISFLNHSSDSSYENVTGYVNITFSGRPDILNNSGFTDFNVVNTNLSAYKTVSAGSDASGMTARLIISCDPEDDDPWDTPSFSWSQALKTYQGQTVTLMYETSYVYTVSKDDIGAVPCVVLDNGNIYTMTDFYQSSTSLITTKRWMLLSSDDFEIQTDSVGRNYIKYNNITAAVNLSDDDWTIRSASIICNQNLFCQTFKFTRDSITPADLTAGTAESSDAEIMEVYNSNVTDLKYMPGTSRYTGFNYYSDYLIEGSTSGNAEDRLVYCTIGHRTPLNYKETEGFKLLFNTTTDNSCYVQGISWAKDNDTIGTLLTPWQEITEDFYPSCSGNKCIYKNKYDEIILLERKKETPSFTPIFDNKYILLNTDAYWNLYDCERDSFFHYASDWNFRCLGGTTYRNTFSAYYSSTYSFMIRNIGASTNQVIARTGSRTLYSNPNIYPVASWQVPVYSKCRLDIREISLYGANEPSDNNGIKLGIDIYYTRQPNSNTSSVGDAYYQYSLLNIQRMFKTELSNQVYVITTVTSSFVNPSLFAHYLDGAGNNDLVFDLKEAYTVSYYNNVPTFLYSISTEVNGAAAFFVIQGQFYAIIENKICSVSYNNGILTSKDPIIDINGMKFVGNNPMIAFFWSERYRAFYSFTGDANLEHIYNADKFYDISGDYYYDKSTQSIYIPTNKGLLVFGPKNTYILEQFKNTSLVQFTSDNITHIEDDNKDISVVFYDKEGYEPNILDLETSFYGAGATFLSTIDRWNITLYDIEHNYPSGEVTVGVRSLNDITVKSEEKKIKITPDMWDRWSHSLLIAYNPKLIKGQGIRLYVKSPFTVQQLTAHIMDDGTGTLTNKRNMI